MSGNIRSLTRIARQIPRHYSSLSKHNGTVHIQRVRVVRPFFTWRRARRWTTWAVTFGILYYGLEYLDDPEEEEQKKSSKVKEAVKQVKTVAEGEKVGADGANVAPVEETETRQVSENEEGEEEDDDDLVPEIQPEDAWFIPFGWPKKCPQTFYKGSDPEWQSFVDFARNKDRVRTVKNELAGLLLHHLGSKGPIKRFCGDPLTAGRFWFDVDFPDGPPQEYERMGIEITDDYVAWTARPVHPVNVSRLENAVRPIPLAKALWAGGEVLWDTNVKRVKQLLSIESGPASPTSKNSPSSPKSAAQQLDESLEEAEAEGGDIPAKQPSHQNTDTTDEKELSTASSISNKSDRVWLQVLPALPNPGDDIAKVSQAFKKTLTTNWKFASIAPPRGTCRISGIVEIYGPKGICLLDVIGIYHPAEAKWMAIGMGIRRKAPRSQRPKGGE